jgi:hypothetical protein
VVTLMAALLRRRRLPAAKRPPLDRDERVVAWAGATGEAVVVVTNYGVWLPSSALPSRLGWHEIHKATWSGRQLTLIPASQSAVVGGYVVVADLPPVSCTLLDPDRVPDQVRTRVTRSIVYTAHHPLPGGGGGGDGGVRVVARHVPGIDGLRWTVRYDDPGVDPSAPEVASATAGYVELGRRGLG